MFSTTESLFSVKKKNALAIHILLWENEKTIFMDNNFVKESPLRVLSHLFVRVSVNEI